MSFHRAAGLVLLLLLSTSAVRAAEPWIGVVLGGERIAVAAGQSGRIVRLLVEPGASVRAGQVLFELDAGDAALQAQAAAAQLAEARAALAAAAVALDRVHAEAARQQAAPQLFSQTAREATALDLRSRQADRDAAAARVRELEAGARRSSASVARHQIRAPADGVVLELLQAVGEQVNEGAAVLRLEAAGAPRVRFALPPEVAPGLVPGQSLRVVGSAGASQIATLKRIAPLVDAASGLVFAEALLPDAATWTSGAAVTVRRAEAPP